MFVLVRPAEAAVVIGFGVGRIAANCVGEVGNRLIVLVVLGPAAPRLKYVSACVGSARMASVHLAIAWRYSRVSSGMAPGWCASVRAASSRHLAACSCRSVSPCNVARAFNVRIIGMRPRQVCVSLRDFMPSCPPRADARPRRISAREPGPFPGGPSPHAPPTCPALPWLGRRRNHGAASRRG